MRANNTSDAWPLVGFNASTVLNTFSPIISFTLDRKVTSNLLGVLQRVCLPHSLILYVRVSSPYAGKQYFRCIAARRISASTIVCIYGCILTFTFSLLS